MRVLAALGVCGKRKIARGVEERHLSGAEKVPMFPGHIEFLEQPTIGLF